MLIQDLPKFSKGDTLILNRYTFIVADLRSVNGVTYYQLTESNDLEDSENRLGMFISEIKLLNLGTFQNYYRNKIREVEDLRDQLIQSGELV